MTVQVDAALLARRLARLRAAREQLRHVPARAPEPHSHHRFHPDSAAGKARRDAAAGLQEPRPASGTTQRDDRAHRLAEALGAVVEEGPAGPVVVREGVVHLPLAREQLSGLPYPIEPDRPLVCIDTETTGLGTAAGTLPFLVGVGRWCGDELRVRQLVLPDQPDEPAFLAALALEIPPDAWLVTYNGRSFDWPLLVTRYRLQRRAPPPVAGHLDLLPLARQLWRHRLPDARLASVERGVAGVVRHGDLGGALIPERYFRYLRSGHGSLLRDVLDHNRQDIISLGHLLAELAHRLAVPGARVDAHPGDVGGLGRAYFRRRRLPEALECYEAALRSADRSAPPQPDMVHVRDGLVAERARVLRRLGRRDEAASAWLALAEGGGRRAGSAWLHVARDREHRCADLRGALDATLHAGVIAARARLTGRPLVLMEQDVVRREIRLRRRLAAQVMAGDATSGGHHRAPRHA